MYYSLCVVICEKICILHAFLFDEKAIFQKWIWRRGNKGQIMHAVLVTYMLKGTGKVHLEFTCLYLKYVVYFPFVHCEKCVKAQR